MMLDFGSMFGQITAPLYSFLLGLLFRVFCLAAGSVLVFLFGFFISCRLSPFHLSAATLRKAAPKWFWFDLFRWMLVDLFERDLHKNEFAEYGFTFFVGRQGAGKTLSMARYLETMRKRYPNCLVVTNFAYSGSDRIMDGWRDLLEIRNGTDGVIFAIDEIHSEYSAASWKDVPESLLSEISQQRKQRVKIVATAQFFTRVAKPLREQAMTVVACECFLGRLVRNREYDALEYASAIDNPIDVKRKVRPLKRCWFIGTDELRACYDTYQKIIRMRKIDFIPRNERGE